MVVHALYLSHLMGAPLSMALTAVFHSFLLFVANLDNVVEAVVILSSRAVVAVHRFGQAARFRSLGFSGPTLSSLGVAIP